MKYRSYPITILALFVIFLLSGCILFRKTEFSKQPKKECIQDSNCSTGGCSGEICGPKEKIKDLVTVCVLLPEYQCLKMSSCKCIDGKCQWKKTDEFKDCMTKYNRDIEDFDFKE